MNYKIDKGDVKGFLLGVVASLLAVYILDKYKQKKGVLEYGEQKVIDEVNSAIDGLKQHINEKL